MATVMLATAGGALLPSDLCTVLSLPEVECCVIVEPWTMARLDERDMRRWAMSWRSPSPRLRGRTGVALCLTPLALEERTGICRDRWRPITRRQRKIFQRRACHSDRGQPASRPARAKHHRNHTAGHGYRPKNGAPLPRWAGPDAARAQAHRRWNGPGLRTRSIAAIRQKRSCNR